MSLKNELSLMGAIAALFLRRRAPRLATGLGAAALALRLLPNSFSPQNRSVIVAGGSRGLGLALAKELRLQGAHVTLLARDEDELARAIKLLVAVPGSGRVRCFRCDLTRKSELSAAIDQVITEEGRIDLFIHNAGVIGVGPFASLNSEDFHASLNLHLHAAAAATSLLLPHFRQAGGGRILFISSVGGKLPVPHLSSYCAGKFALAGFSQAAGAELAREGIFLTTAFPGLMRTGSNIQAVFTGDTEAEYEWFAAAGNTPGLSLGAEHAARKIIAAVCRGDREIIISIPAKVGVLAYHLFPESFLRITQIISSFLPPGESSLRKTGAESDARFERNEWLAPIRELAHQAEVNLNQQRKTGADHQIGIR